MVSKKILAVAIAAAFSSSAFALTVDPVTIDGVDNLNYAKEAILTTAETAEGSGLYAVTGLSSIDSGLGFGVATNDQRFILIKLNGAVFTTDVAAADLTVDGDDNLITGAVVAQGGNAGDDYVILSFTAASDYAQDAVVDLAVAGLAIKASGASITYSLYETGAGAAGFGTTDRLYTKTLSSALTVSNALSTTFTATNATADVATDFTQFVGSSTNESLGTVTFALDTFALLPDSTLVSSLDEVASDESDVVITGDLSFGDWDLNGCTIDADTGSLLEGGDAGCLLSDFSENVAYNVSVSVDGETTINQGAYSAATDYAAITDAAFSPVDGSGSLGSIVYNATTVQVPFVTTNTDSYKQKFVLVNRGKNDAAYKFSFTSEGTVTAANGTKYQGTIPAGKTIVLQATDVVTLTGGTRTAATITINAQEANIDAATQLINSVTNGSDTVNLIDHSQGTAFSVYPTL